MGVAAGGFRACWRGGLALALMFGALPCRAQTHTDVIRGRVTGPDSAGLAGVVVIARSLPDSAVQRGRTDAKGDYTINFLGGGGTYVVAVAVMGNAPQQRRVTRAAGDSAIVVNFQLTQVAVSLGAVRSRGQRPRSYPSDVQGVFGPGSSSTYASTGSALTGDPTGDLTAALATLPGVTVTPDAAGGLPAITAFGLGADQTAFTLNGMSFGGGSVPRDGFSLQAVTGLYDPGKGGFGGVLASLRLSSGSNIHNRSLHYSIDAPSMQWTSPVASQLGTRYEQNVLSGTVSGPIVWDHASYNTSFQFSRRTSPLSTLLSESATSLAALGLSADSVSRMLADAQALGLPATAPGVPGERTATSGSFYGRADYRPEVPPPGVSSLSTDTYTLLAGGSWNDNGGLMAGPTSLPAVAGHTSHWDGMAQATVSKFLGPVLNETNVTVGGNENRTTPYLNLPSAIVLVGGTLPDGSPSYASLQAGGGASGTSDVRHATWEARNETSWYTWDRRHQFKITADATGDRFAISQAPNGGAFTYNSLANFADGLPASFSRTLSGRQDAGQGVNAALGVGEIYAPFVLDPKHAQLQIQYGLRLEGNHVSIRPAFNPAVDSLFGLRTDHVPDAFTVVPMAGFTQQFGHYEYFPGQIGTRGTISGGIREYRGTFSSSTVDNYARATGLPSGIQQLSCVGSAVPTPDWSAYAQAGAPSPSQCADGTAGSPLALTTPPVALFAPDYALSRSWRGALKVSSYLLSGFYGSVGTTYALNRNQPGAVDVNFAGVPQMALAAEGGRPVFVPSSGIVPSSGATAFALSRRYPDFAHVTESESDLRGEQLQFDFTLQHSPTIVEVDQGYRYYTLNYTLAFGRAQSTGFGGTTAGDPRTVEWVPGNSARHRFTVNFTQSFPNLAQISLLGTLQSGIPYTPRVNGDINGDGYANDRAFIFAPAQTADTAVAAAMTRLLAAAPRSARSCLARQLGTVAGAGSCAGPWSSTLNLTVSPDARRLHLGSRATVNLTFTNLLGALDQAVHGPDHLAGWGTSAFPDQTLLNVRGYDATANRFLYTVNPLFGSTSVSRNAFRSPFRITLDVRIDVGPDRETEYMGIQLHPAASDGPAPLTAAQIKTKLERNGTTPFDQFIQRKDSLGLSPAQVDTLNAVKKRYLTVRDSAYTQLAAYLAPLHGDYGASETRERWHSTIATVERVLFQGMRQIGAALTPEQRAKAPFGYSVYLTMTDAALERILSGPMYGAP